VLFIVFIGKIFCYYLCTANFTWSKYLSVFIH